MTTFFTSDLHFSHKNICKFTDRHTITSQEQHDDWLADLWNSQVKKSDKIWHLGDFWFGSDYEQLAALVKRLNGQKFFIKGNHDREKNLKKLKDDNLIQMYYQYEEIKIQDTSVCLFHFPITSWHKQHYGAIHLHGHCHGTLAPQQGKILDVGLDNAYKVLGEYKFFTEEDVVEYMENISIRINDHHKQHD